MELEQLELYSLEHDFTLLELEEIEVDPITSDCNPPVSFLIFVLVQCLGILLQLVIFNFHHYQNS